MCKFLGLLLKVIKLLSMYINVYIKCLQKQYPKKIKNNSKSIRLADCKQPLLIIV